MLSWSVLRLCINRRGAATIAEGHYDDRRSGRGSIGRVAAQLLVAAIAGAALFVSAPAAALATAPYYASILDTTWTDSTTVSTVPYADGANWLAGVFTPPRAGVYVLTVFGTAAGGANSFTEVGYEINSGAYVSTTAETTAPWSYSGLSRTFIVNLAASDHLSVLMRTGSSASNWAMKLQQAEIPASSSGTTATASPSAIPSGTQPVSVVSFSGDGLSTLQYFWTGYAVLGAFLVFLASMCFVALLRRR